MVNIPTPYPGLWRITLSNNNTYIETLSSTLKQKLPEYLELYGREINRHRRFRCVRPEYHTNSDLDFSAQITKNADGTYIWYCHVCKAGGTIIDAAEHLEAIPARGHEFIRLIRTVAGKLSVPVNEEEMAASSQDAMRRYRQSEIMTIMESYIYEKGDALVHLTSGRFGRSYTEEQAVRILEIVPCGVVRSEDLTSFLLEKGCDLTVLPFYMTDRNLIDPYLFNEDRLILSIRDSYGTCIGFTARAAIDKDVKPKYKSTTGLPKKGILFLGNVAKEAIRSSRRIQITEGPFDAISAHLNGFKNTIATLGADLAVDSINTLKQMGVVSLIMAYDPDKAGIMATKKTISLCQDIGIEVLAVPFPHGQDIDEYLRKGEASLPLPIPAVEYVLDHDYDLNGEDIPHDLRYTRMLEFVTSSTHLMPIFRKCATIIANKVAYSVEDILRDLENYQLRIETKSEESRGIWNMIESVKDRGLTEKIPVINDALNRYREMAAKMNTGIDSHTIQVFNSLLAGDQVFPKVITTPFPLLNKATAIECSALAIMSGYPSNGKSSFVRALVTALVTKDMRRDTSEIMSHSAGFNSDIFVLYVSTDDQASRAIATFTSAITEVDREIIKKYIERKEFTVRPETSRHIPVINEIFTNRLCILGLNECPNIASIRRHADVLREKFKDKTLVVVVDAINNLSDLMRDDQRIGVERVILESKSMATSLEAAVIDVTHLTKQKGATRPTLRDLKGSSFIEYEAKSIYLTHMDMHYNSDTVYHWDYTGPLQDYIGKLPIMELIVAKDKEKKANETLYYNFFPPFNQFTERTDGDALRRREEEVKKDGTDHF